MVLILSGKDTGYDGAGTTVAIIDTGIDGAHVGLDDLDDDNSTNDPKIIGFYDPINNPDKTNGTEVFPYDDQGLAHTVLVLLLGQVRLRTNTLEWLLTFIVGVKVLDNRLWFFCDCYGWDGMDS